MLGGWTGDERLDGGAGRRCRCQFERGSKWEISYISVGCNVCRMSQQDVIHLKIDRRIVGQDGSCIFEVLVTDSEGSGVGADLLKDRASFGTFESLHLFRDGAARCMSALVNSLGSGGLPTIESLSTAIAGREPVRLDWTCIL